MGHPIFHGAAVNLAEMLAGADDLDAVIRAVAREEAIRQGMADTRESREIVESVLDAAVSMDQEAVLDLVEGNATTLMGVLARYITELEGRDELQPRDRIIGELESLLAYPWPGVPGAEDLAREIHESYTRLSAQRPGYEVVPWGELDPTERELATAVVSDLIGRGVLRKA